MSFESTAEGRVGVESVDGACRMRTDVRRKTVACKLLVKRCHYDLRKYFFSNRIINIWNSLPDSIVMVDTVNQFQNRLDKYWKNNDFVYDHRATYTGTGGRF